MCVLRRKCRRKWDVTSAAWWPIVSQRPLAAGGGSLFFSRFFFMKAKRQRFSRLISCSLNRPEREEGVVASAIKRPFCWFFEISRLRQWRRRVDQVDDFFFSKWKKKCWDRRGVGAGFEQKKKWTLMVFSLPPSEKDESPPPHTAQRLSWR